MKNVIKRNNATIVHQSVPEETLRKKLMLLMENHNTYVRKHANFFKTYIVSNAYRSFHIEIGLLRLNM